MNKDLVQTGVVPLLRFSTSGFAARLELVDQRREPYRRLKDGVNVGQGALASLELLREALEVGKAFEVIIPDDVPKGRMEKVVDDRQALCSGSGKISNDSFK